MQCYELTIDIIIRTQLYGSELLRQQLKAGENYVEVKELRQMVINASKPLKGCTHYRHDFTLYDKEHGVEFPYNKMYITMIQLEYIEQVLEDMDAFNQLMYLFKNNEVYDKIKTDRRVEEAIEMHKEYIATDENYQEYIDRIDNEMIINSKIKLAKMYEEKAERYSQKVERLSEEVEKLHEEKTAYNQIIRNNIHQYIQKEFKEDISQWLNSLNEEQLFIIQDHLYSIKSIDELKTLI